MLQRFNLFRLAAVLLVIFDLGHTLGGVLFHSSTGVAEDLVIFAMKSTHLHINGADVTYWGFHTGCGLLTSVFLLFSAYLAWYLGQPEAPSVLMPIGWALFLSQVCVAVLSWTYFFAGPGVLSTAVAVSLGIACMRRWSANQPKTRAQPSP